MGCSGTVRRDQKQTGNSTANDGDLTEQRVTWGQTKTRTICRKVISVN